MTLARRSYFDHNATTPLDPRVRAVMVEILEAQGPGGWAGNPSSIHGEGRSARDVVETARRQVASLVGGSPEQIVFTSGGTEADLLGLAGVYRQRIDAGRPARVLVVATEHPAVWGAAEFLARTAGAEVETVPVDAHGAIDLERLGAALSGGAAALAVALCNHELGTVHGVAEVAALCAEAGCAVHVDAVQAAARIEIDAAALGADTLALSAHKMYASPGTGALWIRPGVDIEPLAAAGHQERGRRPGTENLVGIAGMGAAAALLTGPAAAAERAALGQVTAALEQGLVAQGARIHGAGAPRAPGTVNAGFPGVPGELVVQALDLAGVAASTGAACTSGTVAASPVLLALGLGESQALEGVRLSAGRGTTPAEVGDLLSLLPAIVARIRQFA